MFVKHHQVSLKDASNSTDESVFHPLPNLFRLLGLSPFKKVVVWSRDVFFFPRPLLFYIISIFSLSCYILFLPVKLVSFVGKGNPFVSNYAVSCTGILTCILACFLGRVNSQ